MGKRILVLLCGNVPSHACSASALARHLFGKLGLPSYLSRRAHHGVADAAAAPTAICHATTPMINALWDVAELFQRSVSAHPIGIVLGCSAQLSVFFVIVLVNDSEVYYKSFEVSTSSNDRCPRQKELLTRRCRCFHSRASLTFVEVSMHLPLRISDPSSLNPSNDMKNLIPNLAIVYTR